MKPYFETMLGKLYQGDVLDVLKRLPDESVNCIVTSPPYWNLRDYGVEGQFGLEPTLNMYLEHMLQVTAELHRVLKKTGVCFWNHGSNYQDKCDTMQNWRLIIRMVDEQGFILRNSIIWCLVEDTKLFVIRKGKYLHIPIKKIKKGDFIATIDKKNSFRWVRIRNKFDNGVKPVLKVTTKSGKKVICSEEHQFPVKFAYHYGEYLKLKFKKAGDLTKKDFLWVNYKLHVPLPKGDENDYQKGFVVGFFLAEGSYIKRKIGIYKDNAYSKSTQKRWGRLKRPKVVYDGVQFGCGKKDFERGYLKYLKLFDVTIKNYKGNSLSVYSRDKELLKLIRKFVKKEHCDGKHLSQVVWNKSLQFIKGIVDGFLAGDGSFDVENNRWRVRIKPNQQLKEDLELACRLVGYEFRCEGIYNTNYGTKAMGFVIRKEIKRNTFGFLYIDQIEKIEKIGEKKVYDIEVEPIYTSYCGKGKSNKPTKEKKKAKWNNLYFLANGIWVHNSKPNHMPSSVKDRFASAYEPVFMLVKQRKYWFDLDAVRVKHSKTTKQRAKYITNQGRYSKGQGDKKSLAVGFAKSGVIPSQCNFSLGKNPGDLWSIPTQPFPEAHFAVYPLALVERCIKAGCPAEVCMKCGKARERIVEKNKITRPRKTPETMPCPERGRSPNDCAGVEIHTIGWTDCGCGAKFEPGIVLDPFMGSGTTAIMAEKLGRRWIGIELNPEYCEIAKKRLSKYKANLFSVIGGHR